MIVKQYQIWIADLNPRSGTEPGKTRPVLVVQTNLLNQTKHPSTIVCPVTTNVINNSTILRVHLSKGTAGVLQDCDIMMDQIRSVDNKRLIKKIGLIPKNLQVKVKENIEILFDI